MASPPETGSRSDSGFYTRKSSGLVREVGVKEVIALSAGFVAIGFLFFSVPTALGVLPNGNFTWPIIAATVSWVFTALVYWQLTAAMPRSGGDYIYASRIFGPAIGAMVGLGLLLAMMFIFYVNCEVFINPELAFCFWALSRPLSSPALASFSTTLTTPTGTFVGTLVMTVVSTLVCLLSVRRVTTIIFGVVVFAILGFLLATGVMLAVSRTAFIHALAGFSGGNTGAFAQILQAAHHAGWAAGVTASDTFSLYPFAFLLLLGVTAANLTGGELKRPQRSYLIGVGSTVLALTVCLLVGWFAMEHLVGLSFLQASSFLTTSHPATLANITSAPLGDSGIFYAYAVAGSVIRVLIAVSFPATHLVGPLILLLLTSRLVFALSWDRLLPVGLSTVSARLHTPVRAVVFTSVGGVIFAVLGRYTGLAALLATLSLVFAVMFVLASAALAILPYRRRDLYAAIPKPLGEKWFGVPPATVIGVSSVLVNGFVAYLIATTSAISGSYDLGSVLTLVVIFAAGPVLYFVGRLTRRNTALDPRLAMRELPPE